MSLYFSRLTLNRDPSARAIAALLDPEDASARADAHHRLIWTLFSDAKDRQRDFLWRADGRGRFFTLSARPPAPHDLFRPPETKVFDPQLRAGDRLHFLLRANTTKDRAAVGRLSPAERRGKSRRVDLVMDLLRAVPPKERAGKRTELAKQVAPDWMARQGAAKGFRPLRVEVDDYSVRRLGRGKKRGMTHGVLDLSGSLEVTAPALFLPALAMGFGRAKAWGCGLMLIRRDHG